MDNSHRGLWPLVICLGVKFGKAIPQQIDDSESLAMRMRGATVWQDGFRFGLVLSGSTFGAFGRHDWPTVAEKHRPVAIIAGRCPWRAAGGYRRRPFW